MSSLSDFFTSPQERYAEGIQNPYAGVTSLQSFENQFGAQPFDTAAYQQQVNQSFQPAKKTLATQRARALSRSGSARNATPGMTNAGIESGFAEAESGLEGQEAQGELSAYDKATQQNNWLAQAYMNALNSKQQGERMHAQSLSPSSTFEDVLSGASVAAGVAADVAAL